MNHHVLCLNPLERFVQQAGPTIEEIAQERLEAFKLKVQKQERLERLWTTHGSSARAKCSVWAPIVTLGNIVQRNKVSSAAVGYVSDRGNRSHGFGVQVPNRAAGRLDDEMLHV